MPLKAPWAQRHMVTSPSSDALLAALFLFAVVLTPAASAGLPDYFDDRVTWLLFLLFAVLTVLASLSGLRSEQRFWKMASAVTLLLLVLFFGFLFLLIAR